MALGTGSMSDGAGEITDDLVCGVSIESSQPQFFSDYDGRIYPFCSPECKRKFDDHPDTFIQQRAREELGLS